MTLFNFTVRATDDAGAFADRDFSIKIRNSIVDRYMTVNATDSYTSPEGSTWTQRVTYGGQGVVHGAGKWLIPISTTQYRLSVDGINYTTHSWPQSQHVTPTVRWVNGRFVYIGNNGTNGVLVYSYDGLTWTQTAGVVKSVTNSGEGAWLKYCNIIYIDGKWYVANHQGSSLLTAVARVSADDGATWANVTTGYTFAPTGFYHYNGLWIALSGESTANGRVYTSNDTVVWTPRTLGTTLLYTTRIGTDLLYGNGRLVMPLHKGDGTNTTSAVNTVLTSVNGIDWTANTYADVFVTGQTGYSGRVQAIYHNGLFMLCCNTVNGSGSIGGLRVSEDGVTWTTRNASLGALLGLSGLSQG